MNIAFTQIDFLCVHSYCGFKYEVHAIANWALTKNELLYE